MSKHKERMIIVSFRVTGTAWKLFKIKFGVKGSTVKIRKLVESAIEE
jgi:hypothetical protein